MGSSHPNLKRVYWRYLSAAFGSAMITSVYSIADMAIVGQYQGPDGTAALAVVAPVWNVIYSLGLLMGIGGSVLFSTMRGQAASGRENEYFSAALIGSGILCVLAWLGIALFETPILSFFGADAALLPLARAYLKPVKIVLPLFLLNQMLAAFLRNDSHPGLATAGVLAGGIFNVAGDLVFVFLCDWGIFGAGLATAIGSCISFAVMLTHFRSPRNTLSLRRPAHLLRQLQNIAATGFSPFFSDAAMGILTVLFNRQIMRFLGPDALAVYGPIINVSTFVQCCGYSVGQAAQPLISACFGSGQGDRIREILRCALCATAAFCAFWTALGLLHPMLFINLFMKPTPEITAIAPGIVRLYSLSFLFLPLNIFAAYYFQTLMKPAAAFVVSVFRGCVISGLLIMTLPAVIGPDAIWLAMPITELLLAAYSVSRIIRFTKQLPPAA